MAKRLIKESIVVARDGKRITPEIGKVFDLTAEEIKDLERIRPQAIAKVNSHEEDTQSVAVADPDDSRDDPDGSDAIGLEDMDRKALVALASERGVEHAKNASREKIIAAITDAEAGDADL